MTGIAVAFAQSDAACDAGARPQCVLAWPLHARARLADPAARHEAVQHAVVVSPRRTCARLIAAIRAIFADWYDGVKLDFRGEFYTHTLMTPTFRPTDTSFGKPPICLAAVGPLMTQLAGEVADGMYLHSFTGEATIRSQTLPQLAQGLALADRGAEAARLLLAVPRHGPERGRVREGSRGRVAASRSMARHRRTGPCWNSTGGAEAATAPAGDDARGRWGDWRR